MSLVGGTLYQGWFFFASWEITCLEFKMANYLNEIKFLRTLAARVKSYGQHWHVREEQFIDLYKSDNVLKR